MEAKVDTISSLLSESLKLSSEPASSKALVLANARHINTEDAQLTESDESDSDASDKKSESTDEDIPTQHAPRDVYENIEVGPGDKFLVDSLSNNYFGPVEPTARRTPASVDSSKKSKTYKNIKCNGGSFMENSNSNNTNAIVSTDGVFPAWMAGGMGGGMPQMSTPGMMPMGPMGYMGPMFPMGPMGYQISYTSYGSQPKKQGRRKTQGL
ncbi:hypothetical protein NLJ89_g2238 [Agrocybe chaxingu]|uniref:Uncharacterized protein n=1 Tax=Agrocybe chaxingu TaxID=84603 RepID=A0A9W8K7R7_9AGAR|nr:hypothetical protein NLJ89_g2238 [Agrocybe chaxingu]